MKKKQQEPAKEFESRMNDFAFEVIQPKTKPPKKK